MEGCSNSKYQYQSPVQLAKFWVTTHVCLHLCIVQIVIHKEVNLQDPHLVRLYKGVMIMLQLLISLHSHWQEHSTFFKKYKWVLQRVLCAW